jgi:RNA polymerase sigma factor, sigma-70 family
MDTQGENRLLEEIHNGKKDAFAELVEPFIAKSYQTAYAILRSTHLAEEAVQNAMLEAYKSIKSGKEIRNFSGWFSRIVANRALDLVRMESRHCSGLDIDGVVVQDTAATPIDEMMKKEQSSQLLDAVMSLEIGKRTVIVLHYFQDMKIEEIAVLLHLSEGNVKTRLHRARISLRKLVPFPEVHEKVVRL